MKIIQLQLTESYDNRTFNPSTANGSTTLNDGDKPMMASAKPSAQTLDRMLDDCFYQAAIMASDGDLRFDDGQLVSLTRENALELIREGGVLKVYAFNLNKSTCSDITNDLEGEAEYEIDNAITQGETYIRRLSHHGNSVGRSI